MTATVLGLAGENECDGRWKNETSLRGRSGRRSKAGSLDHSLYSEAQEIKFNSEADGVLPFAGWGLIYSRCKVAKSEAENGEWRDRLEEDGSLGYVGELEGLTLCGMKSAMSFRAARTRNRLQLMCVIHSKYTVRRTGAPRGFISDEPQCV